MPILVILAHPDKKSFNHAIAAAVCEQLRKDNHEVIWHDLYAEGFDPLLPTEEFPKGAVLPEEIERHCAEAVQAEGIIIIHPNWWGMPPAILKGWVDRVLRPGTAYEFLEDDQGEGVPQGLLKAKAALVFNTANTPAEREMNVFTDPLEVLWKTCIFDLCGVKRFQRRMFGVVVTSSAAEREGWLDEARAIVAEYFPQLGVRN
jgi:NAD(P)H dehydrogenase (quinone)